MANATAACIFKAILEMTSSDVFLRCFVELVRLALKMPRAIVFAIVLVITFPIVNPKGGIPTDLDFELNFEPKQISTCNQTPTTQNKQQLRLLSFDYFALFT